MAITIVKQPQSLTPVYNQMVIAATSSNFQKKNFQFVADIVARGVTQSRVKVPVNPEGYGVFDIHRHIQNVVSFDFYPESTGWNIATQSMATYSVHFSEEWRPEWEFLDNYFFSGNIGFRGIDSPPFSVGDEIVVTQDDPYTVAAYNGLATVTNVFVVTTGPFTGQYVVVTNKPFIQSTPAEPGVITLSNFRTKIFPSSTQVSERYAFNGALSYLDYINWDWTEWVGQTSAQEGKFLTNVPDNYYVREDSRMWLNAYTNESTAFDILQVATNNGIFRNENLNSFTDQSRFMQVAVGPYNLTGTPAELIAQGWTAASGSFPIIDSTTDSYKVGIRSTVGTNAVETKTFNIDRKCSRYEKVQLIFLDKKGSFIPYTFTLVNKQNKSIKRTNYQTIYGNYAPAANAWEYNTYDRGMKNLDTVVTDEWTINSDWVNQETSNFLMELFESPEVYWIREDGVVLAINVTTNSVERKQTINSQIINYTLKFELSNKNSIQNG